MKTPILNQNDSNRLGPPNYHRASALTKWTGLSLLFLLMASPAWTWAATESQSVDGLRINTSLERNKARIAEPIRMTIEVEAPENVLVRFPDSLDQLGNFDVAEFRDELDIPIENGRRYTRHLTLENIHAGEQAIPSLDVAYTDRRLTPAISGVLKTDERIVMIASSLEGPENPVEFRFVLMRCCDQF